MDQTELNIIKYGRLNGKTKEQVIEAINNYHAGKLNMPQSTAFNPNEGSPPEPEGFSGARAIERLKADVTGTPQRAMSALGAGFQEAQQVADESKAQGENPVVGIAKTSGAFAKGFTNMLMEAVKGIPFVGVALEGTKTLGKPALEATGEALRQSKEGWAQSAPFQALGNKLYELETTNPGTARTVIDILESFKNPTGKIGEELAELEQSNPEAVRFIEDSLEVAKGSGEVATAALTADMVARGVSATARAGADTVKRQTQRLVDSSKELIKRAPEAKDAFTQVKNTVKTPKDIEGVTGEVLQGKPVDVSKGIDTFKHIDTTGVKTFKQLGDKIDDAIPRYADIVDDALKQDPTRYSLDKLATQFTTKGGTKIATNYVDDAMKHLKEMYQKIGDVKMASQMDDLIKTANEQGLTRLEVNDISRLYGSTFGKKAFSKLGDPLTSVNAQMYETVRSGLKDVARQGIGGEAAKEADRVLSSLYNTRRLVENNISRVNALNQKIASMGLVEKIGHHVAKYADMLSGGAIRGFVGGMLPRGAGYKVMNALDLEQRLAENLKLINSALQTQSQVEIIKAVEKLGASMSDDVTKAVAGSTDDIAKGLLKGDKGAFDIGAVVGKVGTGSTDDVIKQAVSYVDELKDVAKLGKYPLKDLIAKAKQEAVDQLLGAKYAGADMKVLTEAANKISAINTANVSSLQELKALMQKILAI